VPSTTGHRLEIIDHVDPAGHRRPAEDAREQDDQQQAPPEDRHGKAGERGAHKEMVERRAAIDPGDHPGRQPDQGAEQDAGDRELDRRRKQREELLDHRLPRGDRAAEVAMRQIAEVGEVLLPERLVVTELGPQHGMALGGDPPLADQEFDRIARDQPDQHERDDGDPEEGRDQDAEAGEDEAQHGSGGPPPGAGSRMTPTPVPHPITLMAALDRPA
jgi:hypothetical protein